MSNSTSTNTTPTTSSSTPSATSSSSSEPSSSSSSVANSSPTTATPSTDTSSLSISFSSTSTSSQSTSRPSSSVSSTPSSTSSTPLSTTSPSTTSVITSLVTVAPTSDGNSSPSVITEFSTSTEPADTTQSSKASSTSSSSASGTAGLISSGKSSSSSGLGTSGKIAVAVVVPIVAVALLVLLGLWLWRKRKARKDAEELRRKEVEEYGYNPNNDPTLPAVGAAGSDGPFEMREDGSSGYRGWGTTAVPSSGRKASTTLSGGNSAGGIGKAYSDGTSPEQGMSETRSDNPLVDGRPISGETEELGAMGPAASGNKSDGVNRGPSNASSSYSAANRSDGSGEAAVPGGAFGAAQYYAGDGYGSSNPYGETNYGSPPRRAEMSGQPVIRDVQARRNTRIENPSHFPQQSAGISQNF